MAGRPEISSLFVTGEELIAADFPSAAVAYGCGDELMEGKQWPEKLYRFQILLRSSNGKNLSYRRGSGSARPHSRLWPESDNHDKITACSNSTSGNAMH